MRWTGVAMVCGLLFACADEQAPEPPPPEVIVAPVTLQPFQPEAVYVGRLRATDDVQIRASVSGYLEQRHFREGDVIEKGQLLYAIDRSQYQADLSQAQAQLARQQAALSVAERNYARGRELAPEGYISASELDELRAAALEAEAGLQAAQAQVEAAEVALGYTRIHAPIAGRIGRSQVSIGDLVGPDSGALTTLVSVDPIKAHFQISEQTLLAVQRLRRERARAGQSPPEMRVALELASGDRYPHIGEIDFVSNRVDAETGTLDVRASFPNPDGQLRPGQYVRSHVLLEPRRVLMIPQSAVQSDQQGTYVLTVENGTVARHNVEVGERRGTEVVVESGLKENVSVIVGGLQKAQPGQTVTTRALAETAPPRAAALPDADEATPLAEAPDEGTEPEARAGAVGASGRADDGAAAPDRE